jgi:hypothetical protein
MNEPLEIEHEGEKVRIDDINDLVTVLKGVHKELD